MNKCCPGLQNEYRQGQSTGTIHALGPNVDGDLVRTAEGCSLNEMPHCQPRPQPASQQAILLLLSCDEKQEDKSAKKGLVTPVQTEFGYLP